MKANIGILEDHSKATGLILNTLVADEHILYTKTKNYHWNVTGASFNDLHLLFDKQAEEIESTIDELAERIRSLGHFTIGTLQGYLKLTRLLEHNGDIENAVEMIGNLLDDHETIIRTLRNEIPVIGENYQDVGTNDFLVGVLQKHEKTAWMLRAYLK